ncbi:hypothetical protein BLNAU_3265 [Blattamonas nauphoetae]|uniref:Uncharacterized protein n=1 Tax=Blattamonas nauphoetae TaxID=2049346 RepID=A0ABQ9YDJ5_9EUKA|nr:hypothetical protein BLNAU_3265 [Blattamonas nauphoetae]
MDSSIASLHFLPTTNNHQLVLAPFSSNLFTADTLFAEAASFWPHTSIAQHPTILETFAEAFSSQISSSAQFVHSLPLLHPNTLLAPSDIPFSVVHNVLTTPSQTSIAESSFLSSFILKSQTLIGQFVAILSDLVDHFTCPPLDAAVDKSKEKDGQQREQNETKPKLNHNHLHPFHTFTALPLESFLTILDRSNLITLLDKILSQLRSNWMIENPVFVKSSLSLIKSYLMKLDDSLLLPDITPPALVQSWKCSIPQTLLQQTHQIVTLLQKGLNKAFCALDGTQMRWTTDDIRKLREEQQTLVINMEIADVHLDSERLLKKTSSLLASDTPSFTALTETRTAEVEVFARSSIELTAYQFRSSVSEADFDPKHENYPWKVTHHSIVHVGLTPAVLIQVLEQDAIVWRDKQRQNEWDRPVETSVESLTRNEKDEYASLLHETLCSFASLLNEQSIGEIERVWAETSPHFVALVGRVVGSVLKILSPHLVRDWMTVIQEPLSIFPTPTTPLQNSVSSITPSMLIPTFITPPPAHLLSISTPFLALLSLFFEKVQPSTQITSTLAPLFAFLCRSVTVIVGSLSQVNIAVPTSAKTPSSLFQLLSSILSCLTQFTKQPPIAPDSPAGRTTPQFILFTQSLFDDFVLSIQKVPELSKAWNNRNTSLSFRSLSPNATRSPTMRQNRPIPFSQFSSFFEEEMRQNNSIVATFLNAAPNKPTAFVNAQTTLADWAKKMSADCAESIEILHPTLQLTPSLSSPHHWDGEQVSPLAHRFCLLKYHSPFLNWYPNNPVSVDSSSRTIMSLASMVRDGFKFEERHLRKASLLLELLNMKGSIRFKIPALFNAFGPNSTDSAAAFVDSMTLIFTLPHPSVFRDALEFFRKCLSPLSKSTQIAVLSTNIIRRILSAPQLRDLSSMTDHSLLKSVVRIFNNCVWFSSPDSVRSLSAVSDADPQSVRDVVLNKVLIPIEQSLVQINRNPRLLSWNDEYKLLLSLQSRIFEVSAFHQPTLDFICSSRIPIVFQSLLSKVEDEDTHQFIIALMNDNINEWKMDGAETWCRGRILLQTLEQEGFRNHLEQTLFHDQRREYNWDVRSYSVRLKHHLGMNSPLPRW